MIDDTSKILKLNFSLNGACVLIYDFAYEGEKIWNWVLKKTTQSREVFRISTEC